MFGRSHHLLHTIAKAARRLSASGSLRSARADIQITPAAADQLKKIAQEGECLRLLVDSGGCSGFEYKLSMDRQVNADDEVIEQDGAKLVIDKMSLGFVKGAKLDYVHDLMRSAFRVTDNPSASDEHRKDSVRAVGEVQADVWSIHGESRLIQCPADDTSLAHLIPSTPGTLIQPKSTSRRLLYLAAPGVLLALPWTVTLKDYFGVQKVKLDKDPIKDKIKHAKLHCKYKRFQEAINVLNEAMEEAKNLANEVAITYIITELANIYLEIGQLDDAESLYREAIIRLHGRNEMSPEFIILSLRLSDVFARKGDLENAEIGYKHCVSKQMQAMDNHLKNYLVAKGAVMEEKHPADVHGPKYTDPIALFGMTLEDYAHFLVENYSQKEDRMKEACEYIDEMIKKFEISHHIFGGYAAPLMVSLNNFGVRCIAKNRFETAKKYLSIGIDRVLQIDNCASILVNYYVNYAEALFHCGQVEEAMKYAAEAEKLAQNQEPAVKEYAEKYRKSMERDARRQIYNKSPSVESGGSGWRSWIPF